LAEAGSLTKGDDVKTRAALIGGCFVALSIVTWGDDARVAAMAQGATQTRTVTGQVVCLVCYHRNDANTGADHDSGRMCAHACIKWEGNPAGIVATDGKVYQLSGGVVADNNTKVLPHIAHRVSVTGEVYVKDGMTMIRTDEMNASP
jgi:hypothetical protein